MPHGVPWVEGNEEGQAPGSTHRDWRQGWDARVWVGSRDSRPIPWKRAAVMARLCGVGGCVGKYLH